MECVGATWVVVEDEAARPPHLLFHGKMSHDHLIPLPSFNVNSPLYQLKKCGFALMVFVSKRELKNYLALPVATIY